jgi:hypothetical protein
VGVGMLVVSDTGVPMAIGVGLSAASRGAWGGTHGLRELTHLVFLLLASLFVANI